MLRGGGASALAETIVVDHHYDRAASERRVPLHPERAGVPHSGDQPIRRYRTSDFIELDCQTMLTSNIGPLLAEVPQTRRVATI